MEYKYGNLCNRTGETSQKCAERVKWRVEVKGTACGHVSIFYRGNTFNVRLKSEPQYLLTLASS